MGFIQQMLQNAQQQQATQPQQSALSRFGQMGLLDSLRNLQGPNTNLPTPSQAQQGGSAPFGGNSGGLQNILNYLRQQSGQQGLGSMMPRPQMPFGQGQTPQVHPVANSGQVPFGMPRPPQAPQTFPFPTNFPSYPTAQPGSQVPTPTPTAPTWRPPTTTTNPQVPTGLIPGAIGNTAQQMTYGTRTNPTTTPSKLQTLQSRYGSLAGR